MTNRMSAISGRVASILGIPAASADAAVVDEPLEPGADPADEPAAEPAAPVEEPVATDPAPEPVEAAPDAAAMQEAMVREAAAVATKAANARWQTVLASAEAKGRGQLATHLLATTEQSADQIRATLALTPQSAVGGDFGALMAGVSNPGVTASGVVEDDRPPADYGWGKAVEKTRGGIRK